MNKLLIDDYPIQVLPKLAEKIGLNEAIILQQMHYWLNNSKHNHDGKRWIYNSYADWQKQFSFWSVITIKRAIYSLEKQDLIFIGNYNKAKFDKTKWYSINYQTLEGMIRPSYQNDTTRISKRYDGEYQNDTTNTIDYTETTSKINRDGIVQIFEYINNNIEMIQSPNKVQEIEYLIADFKNNAYDIFVVAIDYCKEKNKGINYLITILKNWAKEGVMTKEQAQRKVQSKPKKEDTDKVLEDLEARLLGGQTDEKRGSYRDY